MKRLMCVSVIALAMTGCTMIEYTSFAVNQYCALPVEARAANREAVAIAVAPNRIEIDCVR